MATNIRDAGRARGTVLDLAELLSLPDADSNLLCVSTQTLAIIQAYGRLEVNITSRYAREFLPGDRYVVADDEDELDDIGQVANNYRLGVLDMSCEIVQALNIIAGAISSSRADCGCDIGQGVDNESGESGGSVPSNIGDIAYSEPAAVTSRDCKAANLVHQTIVDTFAALNDHNVDDLANIGLIGTVGLAVALIAATVVAPLVAVVVGVAGGMAVMAARIIGLSIDLSDMVTALNEEGNALVCALATATTADGARTAYEAVLEADTTLNSAEIGTVVLFMTNGLLNTLFFDVEGLSDFFETYVTPYDCASCDGLPVTWTFPADFEGWTFEDISAGTGTATRTYITGEIQNTLTAGNDHGEGNNSSPELSIPVVAGNKVRADFSVTSPALVSSKTVRVFYSDLTNTANSSSGTEPVTVEVTIPGTRTIIGISVFMSRGTSSAVDVSLEEVRVSAS